MKLVYFLLIFAFGILKSQSLEEFRGYLKTGESSAEVSKTFLEKSKSAFETTKKPIYEAFYAVSNFFMAKHSVNPINKLSYFNKGKKLLDDAVKSEPNNLEIRLMRLISQEKTPKILGYKSSIASDKDFILKNYKNSPDKDLINFIKKYLKI